MAIPLIVIALVIMAAVINDKLGDLGSLVKGDLFGSKDQMGFIAWVGAIIVLASALKMLNLPEAGRGLIILIIVAYLLGHKEIPGQLVEAIQGAATEGGGAGPAPAPAG